MLKSIEEEWLRFSAIVIPTLTQQHVQYREMKKAFFSGAWVVVNAAREIGEPHISEDEGVRYLNSILAECEELTSKMMREYGESN